MRHQWRFRSETWTNFSRICLTLKPKRGWNNLFIRLDWNYSRKCKVWYFNFRHLLHHKLKNSWERNWSKHIRFLWLSYKIMCWKGVASISVFLRVVKFEWLWELASWSQIESETMCDLNYWKRKYAIK